VLKDIAETRVTEDHRVTHRLLDIKVPAETRVTENNQVFLTRRYQYQVGLDRQDLEETRVKRDPRVIQDSREIRVTKVC
jgi:hypothetical protein